MIGLVVKLLMGFVLFAGSLVGGLAATGRLNHEGTANIPVLRSFFPAPPDSGAAVAGDANGANGAGGASDAKGASESHGAAADAPPSPAGENRPSAEATHAADNPAANDAPASGAPRKQITGQSLYDHTDEEPADASEGDKQAHGKPAKTSHGKPAPASAHPSSEASRDETARPEPRAEKRSLPEADFQNLEHALATGKHQYTPGELFHFQGLPAGVTPDQINEAWQRVQGLLGELERKKLVLEQQEQQQRELSEDISRRQGALGKERVRIEQMQRDLDAKIHRFEEQVKLVRTDEVAALKRNAQTIAAFEPDKAVALIEAQWKTDKGQDEVLKLLEFMDKDAVNEIIKGLPTATQQDVLKKRLHVVKEPAASGKGN